MKNFNEEITAYALSNGFEEISESEITKPEFREKRVDNPFYSALFRKEVDNHLFYILVPKGLSLEERFYLRVYNRFSEAAPRSEHRMRISEFLEYNDVYKVDRNPLADIIGQTFDKLYKDVIKYRTDAEGHILEIFNKYNKNDDDFKILSHDLVSLAAYNVPIKDAKTKKEVKKVIDNYLYKED